MNEGFVILGIFVVVIAFAVMALHPYQRGGVHIGGKRGGGTSGPVYLVIFLVGVGLIGLGIYLPG